MKHLSILALFISPLCWAVPCPSLDFVKTIHFTSVVKIFNGNLDAAANFDGISDRDHDDNKWQFVFGPISAPDPQIAEECVKNLNVLATPMSRSTMRQGINVEDCLYREHGKLYELHGFYCGMKLCFNQSGRQNTGS